jgi:hypothetical protein
LQATAGSAASRERTTNAVCATSTDCPGGLCATFIGDIPIALSPLTTDVASKSDATGIFCPGQTTTQKGAFGSAICNGGTNTGKPCTTTADCPSGTCRAGSLTNYCAGGANDGLGCSSAANCPSPGTCVKAGTLATVIRENGVPAGALTIGVPKLIKLGSVFCVAATSNPTVNSNANLPAAGATSVTGTVTLLHN